MAFAQVGEIWSWDGAEAYLILSIDTNNDGYTKLYRYTYLDLREGTTSTIGWFPWSITDDPPEEEGLATWIRLA